MSGARHEDWSHVHVVGERSAAAPLLGYGRKLLGFIKDESSRRGLRTNLIKRTLPNGAVVIAEIRGGVPRITIIPGVYGGKSKLELPDAFVVWARDTTHTAGIDATHPQQILKPAWRTMFFDAVTAPYAAFTEKKGVYTSAMFPDGIRHAGNVDWIGPKQERISWYGPSTRYFFDPYVQPRSQYGKFVFFLGQALLDVDQYITDSAPDATFTTKYVLGAAINGLHLNVIMADLPVGATSGGSIPAHTVAVDPAWPLGGVPVVFARFTLIKTPTASPALRLHVAPQSRAVLWSGSLQNAMQPAFFSADGSQAVMDGLPDTAEYTSNVGVLLSPPSTSQQTHHWKFSAPTPGSGSPGTVGYDVVTRSMSPNGESVLVTDWSGQSRLELRVRRRDIDQTRSAFVLAFAGAEYPLCVETGVPGNQTVLARYLLFADLRNNVFVFHVVQGPVPAGPVVTSIEVWRRGAVVGTFFIDPADAALCGLNRNFGDTDIYRGTITAVNLAPAFAVYKLSVYIDGFGNGSVLWDGNHSAYAYLPYPASEYFGAAVVNNTGVAQPYVALSTFQDGDFDGDRLDTDSHYSVLGCASDKKTTLLSCYAFQHHVGSSLAGIFGVGSGTTLPTLTDVKGTNKRYHPIWVMGQLPDVAK